MSRSPYPAHRPTSPGSTEPPQREWTADEQPRREQYSTDPKNRGVDGAIARIQELWGVTVTPYYIRRAVATYTLPRHIIGHIVHFTDRDLFSLIVLSTRRTGPVQSRGESPTDDSAA